MSGSHYDCFYEWDDFALAAQNIDLLKEVLRDYEAEPDMEAAATFLREAIRLLEDMAAFWSMRPYAELCRIMDWYQSLDYGKDSFREAVQCHLEKWKSEVKGQKNDHKV